MFFVKQLEAERLKVLKRCEQAQFGWPKPQPQDCQNAFGSFLHTQTEAKKKIVKSGFHTIVSYSTPKLLTFLSNDEFSQQNPFCISILNERDQREAERCVSFQKEIVSHKKNYEKILFDVVVMSKRMDDQLADFEHLMRKIVADVPISSPEAIRQLVSVDDCFKDPLECGYVDRYTRDVLQYLQPTDERINGF